MSDALIRVVQSLGVAYAGGINLPATVALLGFAQLRGWIEPLPGALGVLGTEWVVALAGLLYVVEFVATLVPGVASVWETFQSVVRPGAATLLAVATAADLSPAYVVTAGLLGGGMALTTHGTKLGVRYAAEASPEPFSNGALNVAELAMVASIAVFVWEHPLVTLAIALAVLLVLIVAVRRVWRGFRNAFSKVRASV